jgi:hypothetical protein
VPDSIRTALFGYSGVALYVVRPNGNPTNPVYDALELSCYADVCLSSGVIPTGKIRVVGKTKGQGKGKVDVLTSGPLFPGAFPTQRPAAAVVVAELVTDAPADSTPPADAPAPDVVPPADDVPPAALPIDPPAPAAATDPAPAADAAPAPRPRSRRAAVNS